MAQFVPGGHPAVPDSERDSLFPGLVRDFVAGQGRALSRLAPWRGGPVGVALETAGNLMSRGQDVADFAAGVDGTNPQAENAHPDAPATEVPYAPLDPSRQSQGPMVMRDPEPPPPPPPPGGAGGFARMRAPQLGRVQMPEMPEPQYTPRPSEQPDDLGYTYEDPEFTQAPPEEAALENLFFSLGMSYGPQSEMGRAFMGRFDEIQNAKRQRLADRAQFRAQMMDARHQADLQRRNQFDRIHSDEIQAHLNRKAQLRNTVMRLQNQRDIADARMRMQAGMFNSEQEARQKMAELEQRGQALEMIPQYEQRLNEMTSSEIKVNELEQMLKSGQIDPGFKQYLNPIGPFTQNRIRAHRILADLKLQTTNMLKLGQVTEGEHKKIQEMFPAITDPAKAYEAAVRELSEFFRRKKSQILREAERAGVRPYLNPALRDAEDSAYRMESLRQQRE